jgi:hypothetical protein
MLTSVCESIHTHETVPADDLVFLPNSVQVLPFKTTVCVNCNTRPSACRSYWGRGQDGFQEP